MSDITKNLKTLGKNLPTGAISRIAEATGFSQSYVSKFFDGRFALSDRNNCIIDAAEKELTAEAERQRNAQVRINEMLSKGKE